MLRQLLVLFFCLVFISCGDNATQPPSLKPVEMLQENDRLLEQFIQSDLVDSLSGSLGWLDLEYGFRLNLTDQQEVLALPLEAEDEMRILIVFFDQSRLTKATAWGFAETTWFVRERADTTSVYEGWFMLYDLKDGQRRLSCYYEGGQMLERQSDFPKTTLTNDVLADDQAFACLLLTYASPPSWIKPALFTQGWNSTCRSQLKAELLRAKSCW